MRTGGRSAGVRAREPQGGDGSDGRGEGQEWPEEERRARRERRDIKAEERARRRKA